MIQAFDLEDKVKILLQEEIKSKKKQLLYKLLNTPSSIQKNIERHTRVDNAEKKVDLLISFVTDFIEKIEGLDPKEYKLYTVKSKRSPSYFVMWSNGSEDVGSEFLWREYNIQELDSQRNNTVAKLQSIKSSLDILKRWVSIVDTNNQNEEEQVAFDDLRAKITTQEKNFLDIYSSFTHLIIPIHIADSIDTKRLYKEEVFNNQIQEYFKWKYGIHKEDKSIPDGIDPDSLDFQNKARPYEDMWRMKWKFHWMLTSLSLPQIVNPAELKQIEYLPLQYPIYEYLSYPNPDYEKAQEIRERYND